MRLAHNYRSYMFFSFTESHQDSTLVVLPMFHSYGLSICMLHKMSAGLKLVSVPKFQPDMFLNTLLTHKLQLLYLAPPMGKLFMSIFFLLLLILDSDANKELC